MGCGGSKAAVAVAPAPQKGSSSPDGGVAVTPSDHPDDPPPPKAPPPKPLPPREPSTTPPAKVWVKFAATRRCTAVSLSGEDVDDVLAAGTYTALAAILTGASHVGRLRQLGFSGVAISIVGPDGNPCPPDGGVTRAELQGWGEQSTPLVFDLVTSPIVSSITSSITSSISSSVSSAPHANVGDAPPEGGGRRVLYASATRVPGLVTSPVGLVTSPGSPDRGVEGRKTQTLSPSEKAYRAEVQAMAAKSQAKVVPIYMPGDPVPEVQRDMLSHLKKKASPAKSSPGHSPGRGAGPQAGFLGGESGGGVEEEEEEEDDDEDIAALENPCSVKKVEGPHLTGQVEGARLRELRSQLEGFVRIRPFILVVDGARLRELRSQLDGFVRRHAQSDRTALLREIKGCLTEESWAAFEREAQDKDGAWGGMDCLSRIRGYVEFARHHNFLSKKERLPLKLRSEKDPYYPGQVYANPAAAKCYALIPPNHSLLGGAVLNLGYLVDDTRGTGTFSQWASGRFLDPSIAASWAGPDATRPLFGFCGQLPGLSKQVFGGEISGEDREAAIRACTPDDSLEYPLYNNASQNTSLVRINLSASPHVGAALEPMVVLDAAVLSADGAGDQNGRWRTLPGFGDGTVPGMTRGGRAVLLIRSTQVGASDVEDLARNGVSCSRLPRAPDPPRALSSPVSGRGTPR